jgi:CheY-like chemotaxis protein
MSDIPVSLGGPSGQPIKPLFGVTILLIEDSRAASEALRLFAAESGARLRRADSLAAAHRHLAIFRPNVVIVDLGLPDGNGIALIEALARAPVPFEAVVATSGNEPGTWQAAALEAGAAACLEKPVPSLRAFQECLVALLPDRGPLRAVGAEMRQDGGASLREALEADLRRALGLLEAAVPAGDVDTVAYVAQFLGSMGEASEEAIRLSDVGSGEFGTVEAAMLGGASLIAYLRRRLGSGERVRGAA